MSKTILKVMDFNQFIRTLRIIAFGLIFGVVVIMGVFYFLTQQEGYEPTMADFGEIFLIITALIVAGSYIAADFVTKKILTLEKDGDTGTKITQFRTATIIRFGMYEMAIIVAMVLFYFSGNIGQLVIALLVLGFMLMNIPDKKKVMEKLNIKEDELDKLSF